MKLEPHTISSGEYSRDVWFRPGPKDTPHPLCVFLDGEHYLQALDALPVLEAALEERGMPPLSLLFVSHVSSDPDLKDDARRDDYTCNERYAQFVADVTHWARARNEGIRATGNLICGLSLSGLQAAYVTCRHPETFSLCLSQSGSFWWLEGKDDRLLPTTAKFWLSVGDEETAEDVHHGGLHQRISQVAGVEQAATTLRRLGGTVHYEKRPGGHAAAPWRAELPTALRWLLVPTG